MLTIALLSGVKGQPKLYGWTEAEALGQNAALLLTGSAPDTTLATLMAEADSGQLAGGK